MGCGLREEGKWHTTVIDTICDRCAVTAAKVIGNIPVEGPVADFKVTSYATNETEHIQFTDVIAQGKIAAASGDKEITLSLDQRIGSGTLIPDQTSGLVSQQRVVGVLLSGTGTSPKEISLPHSLTDLVISCCIGKECFHVDFNILGYFIVTQAINQKPLRRCGQVGKVWQFHTVTTAWENVTKLVTQIEGHQITIWTEMQNLSFYATGDGLTKTGYDQKTNLAGQRKRQTTRGHFQSGPGPGCHHQGRYCQGLIGKTSRHLKAHGLFRAGRHVCYIQRRWQHYHGHRQS